jgi:membrane-bound lytic murein transglycosylase D
MTPNTYKSSLRCLVLLACLLGVMAKPAAAGVDPFPTYSCIQPNVAFWKKVYSEYPSTTGLIHDSRDLAIIYEVVNLGEDTSRPGGQTSDQAVEAVKERYRQLLLTLAEGRPPANAEEKRVVALFGPGVTPAALRAAADNIRFQRCLKDRFQAGLVRSGRYLEQIKQIFSRHGLPTDLAYLPHVESSFDYSANSKSGAVGVWQLIKATGKRFLTINSALDERRDPILASQAAAQFLQGNYKKLESWPLALTAYNHGLTAMLRAKNSLGTFEAIYKGYDGDRFGFASKNFYAEFLAAREIAKNYHHYFPELHLSAPVPTTSFTVNRAAGIKVLTRHLKVDLATLAELNPALRETVLSGRLYVPKGYRLRLPKSAGPAAKIASLPPEPRQAGPKISHASKVKSHKVKRGETITKIAERYGITPRELIASNQLDREAVLTTGQQLLIPAPAKPAAQKSKIRVEGKSGKTRS